MNSPALSGPEILADALMRVPVHLDLGREDHRREFSELASSVAPLARSGAIDMVAYMDSFLARVEGTQSGAAENILRDALVSPAPVAEGFLPDELDLDPLDDSPPPASEADYGLPAADTAAADEPEVVTPMDAIDVGTLHGTPPEREWLIRDHIPAATLTTLSGDGGAGKTMLALQLAVAVALADRPSGAHWLGLPIERPGPVIFVTAEEEFEEVWRRLHRILDAEGKACADLTGRLFVKSIDDDDPTFWGLDRAGKVRPTRLLLELEALVEKVRPSLVIVEAIADINGIDELKRGLVAQALRLPRNMTYRTKAAFMLIAHPSRSGQDRGTGESGSTHFFNGVKSFLYLTKQDADPEQKQLVFRKGNYGPPVSTIPIQWERGRYARVQAMSDLQKLAAEAEIDEVFLRCLALRTARRFEDGPNTGKNYAPNIYAAMQEADGRTSKAFAASMQRLIAAGRIEIIKVGPPSRPKSILRAVPQAPTLPE